MQHTINEEYYKNKRKFIHLFMHDGVPDTPESIVSFDNVAWNRRDNTLTYYVSDDGQDRLIEYAVTPENKIHHLIFLETHLNPPKARGGRGHRKKSKSHRKYTHSLK